MKRKELVLEFMKAIAPVIVEKGIEVQKRLVELGSNPSQCTVGGKGLLRAEAQGAREWAEAFADEYLNYGKE